MPTSFVDFVHDLTLDDLPPGAVVALRRLVLDLVGVAAAATGTRLSRLARDHADQQFGAGSLRSHILFDGRAVSPAGAALAGAMTIDALDAHDGHKLTKGHVGCGALPALLALHDAAALTDDRAFLAGLAVGYEVGTRAGIALHRTACDYHTSGAWIAVATAALGARVLRLSATATREAIGIAEFHGPRSQMMRCIDHPTMVKDGSGWGAMAGVSAAFLASAGFTGAPAVTVEGEDVADLWSDLGTRWTLFEQYYKPIPVCRWAQPAIRAALNLREAHALLPDRIRRVEVTTFHEGRRLHVRRPATTEEAQYSTPFPVTAALVRGRVGPEEVSGAVLCDPDVLRIADLVTIEEDDAYNAAFPSRRIAHVTVELEDGTRLVSPPTEALGDPEAPVDDVERTAKFLDYSVPVLGADRAAALRRSVDRLGAGDGLGEFMALVSEPLAHVPDPAPALAPA